MKWDFLVGNVTKQVPLLLLLLFTLGSGFYVNSLVEVSLMDPLITLAPSSSSTGIPPIVLSELSVQFPILFLLLSLLTTLSPLFYPCPTFDSLYDILSVHT